MIRVFFLFFMEIMKAKQWSLDMALIGLGLFYLIFDSRLLCRVDYLIHFLSGVWSVAHLDGLSCVDYRPPLKKLCPFQ